MTKILIFVGYARKSSLEYFLKEGYSVGLLKDKTVSTQTPNESRMDFVIPLDFSNRKTLEKSLGGIRFHRNTLVLALKDRYLLIASFIADIMDLKQKQFLPVDLARNATNKIFQRKEFTKSYPEITPPYKQIRTFHGAYTFSRKYGFPLIIKPAGLAASLLVSVANDLESLIEKTSYILGNIEQVYKDQRVYRTPQVAIERYIIGQQYSVDSYVDKDGNITHTPLCRQYIGYDLGQNNFQTVYSIYTTQPKAKIVKIVNQTVEKAIKSLNIKGNPTHTEVRIDPETLECKIIEVNIRTGGHRAYMLKESFGISHVRNVVNNYLDKPVLVSNDLLKHSACPQFWAEKHGRLKEVEGLEDIKKLKSYVTLENFVKEGQKVGPADLGGTKVCSLILAHENLDQLQKDIKRSEKLLKIKIDEVAPDYKLN